MLFGQNPLANAHATLVSYLSQRHLGRADRNVERRRDAKHMFIVRDLHTLQLVHGSLQEMPGEESPRRAILMGYTRDLLMPSL